MSSNIPTFEQYTAGGTITPSQEQLILTASVTDKATSISKLSELTTRIESLISDLQSKCHTLNTTINKQQKDACRLEKEKHETNKQKFQVLLMKLLTRKHGGKRQTRRHSKHNKNRKQNLKSRRHRNKR